MFVVLRNLCGCRSKQCIVLAIFLALVFLLIRFVPNLSTSAHAGHHHSQKSSQQGVASKVHSGDQTTDGGQPFVVIGAKNLEPVPNWLTRDSLCPACFGADICKDVKDNLQVQFPDDIEDWQERLGKVKFYAKWGRGLVVIRTLVPNDTFVKYDKFLCEMVSLEEDTCNSATAVVQPQSPAIKQESFLPSNLQSAWKIVHPSADALP